MATIQHPHHAPPGTAIRPDGMPAGRGGRYALWLALLVLAGAGMAYAVEHRPRGTDAETVVRVAPERLQPEPAAVPELAPTPTPAVAPEPPPEPPMPSDEPEVISPEPAARCLDEVGCLLAEEPPECCAQYGTSQRDDRDDGVADSLTAADVKTGIAKVRSKIERCFERSDERGTVRVKVKVSPSGQPSTVSVIETPDRPLGTCIAREVKKAKFAKSRMGVTFTFPFGL